MSPLCSVLKLFFNEKGAYLEPQSSQKGRLTTSEKNPLLDESSHASTDSLSSPQVGQRFSDADNYKDLYE